MINISSLLNGEKIEYFKTWVFHNKRYASSKTYQLYITAKHVHVYEIDYDVNPVSSEKPFYDVRSYDLGVFHQVRFGSGSNTNFDSTTKSVSFDSFDVGLWLEKDRGLCLEFSPTTEGQKAAEEVYEALWRAISR